MEHIKNGFFEAQIGFGAGCYGEKHIFQYAGSPPIPDGWRCMCGAKMLVTETCPTCGVTSRKEI